MLVMPAGASAVATVIGLDPGSDTLGVAALNFDVDTLAIVSTHAFTLNGTRNGRGSFASAIHGDRIGRIESHEDNLLQIFRHYNPLLVASESPFMSRRMPAAYGALMEVVSAIRRALMLFDVWRPLSLIDPPTVKRAVGVSGKTGGPEGKKLMLQAILAKREELRYTGDIPLERLDEHSIDAIAVAYCHLNTYLEDLCLKPPSSSPLESSLLSLPHLRTRIIRAARKTRRFKKK